MHDDVFDQVTREGVRGVPRRGLLGLVAGLSALALGRPAGEARRKKRKKCKRGTTRCGKKCFNLTTDSANCGACGAACSNGKICSGGACACPADQSLVDGACIPRFGCTLDLDTCTFGKKLCPVFTNESDALCFVSPNGQPFCATSRTCVTQAPNATCPLGDGQPRIFLPCVNCAGPGDTGVCVRPIAQVRP